jgi:hypothetical protein
MNQPEKKKLHGIGVPCVPRLTCGRAVWLAGGIVIGLSVMRPHAVAGDLVAGVEIYADTFGYYPVLHVGDGQQQTQNPTGSVAADIQSGVGALGGVAHARAGLGWIQLTAFSDAIAGTQQQDRHGYVDTTAYGQFTDELTITPANPALLNQPGTATFAVHVGGIAVNNAGGGVQAGVAIPFQDPSGLPAGFSLNNMSGGATNETIDETIEFVRDFAFGQPFSIRINMFGRGRATADGTANFAVFAEVDLGNTLEWMGTLGVVDELSQAVSDYVVSSASGTDYQNAIEAPPVDIPGDYNFDGSVDAADYVLWRKDPASYGGPYGYNTWRSHFGQTAGSGSGSVAGSAVPEPASLSILLTAAGLVLLLQRNNHRRVWSRT